MMYTQLFDLLCANADNEYGGKLPIHVRCLLDEFANIGPIPQFAKLIATIRSREISACIVLQAQSQLKSLYKDDAETIVGNCDATLFLGGKETIDLITTSETRARENSFGSSYQKLGKDLMSRDELAVMDGALCILMLRGVRPFLSHKYDITKHPYNRYLADADARNAFDIMRYMHHRSDSLKPDEPFTMVEIVLDDP